MSQLSNQQFLTFINSSAQLHTVINDLQRETTSTIYSNFLKALSAALESRKATIAYARDVLAFIYQYPDVFTLPTYQRISQPTFANKDAVITAMQKLSTTYVDLVPSHQHLTISNFIQGLTFRTTLYRSFYDDAMAFAVALFEAHCVGESPKNAVSNKKVVSNRRVAPRYYESSDDDEWCVDESSSDDSSDDSDDDDIDPMVLRQLVKQLKRGKMNQIVNL